jgi:hypothetical protein
MVTASRGLIVDGDDVADVWGSWNSGGDPGGDIWIDVPSLPESLPDAVRELGQDQRVAVAGCETPDGPVALPAAWEPATGRAHVPAGALAVVGAAVPGRACVTLGRSTGMRPSQFAGVMLRGRLTPVGDRLRKLIVERATWWDGFGTGTVDAA